MSAILQLSNELTLQEVSMEGNLIDFNKVAEGGILCLYFNLNLPEQSLASHSSLNGNVTLLFDKKNYRRGNQKRF